MPTLEEHVAPAQAAGLINCAAYVGGRRAASLGVDEIPAALADPEAFLWVGLYEPDEELLAKVQAALGLHDLAVEDAHAAHQRPKLERYGDSLFAVLRTAQFAESGRLDFGETHLFAGPRYVVTVRHGSLTSHVGLRARCEEQPQRLACGPGYVLYALMDFVVDQYLPLLEGLEDQFEAIETEIFRGRFSRAVSRASAGCDRPQRSGIPQQTDPRPVRLTRHNTAAPPGGPALCEEAVRCGCIGCT